MFFKHLNISDDIINKILDKLEVEDIEYELTDCGFKFEKTLDFNDAEEIIEDKVGPFGYESYSNNKEIILLPLHEEIDQIKYYKDLIKEDYKNKKIIKEDYEYKLKFIKSYLESYKEDDIYIENVEEKSEDILNETYSKEEIEGFINKIFNQQKILNIYHRKKYGQDYLFAHTRCVNCGREKKVFLANLVTNPDKYGSCICSDVNINARLDNIEDLYSGRKKLSSNTSGYTGVYFVKKYKGQIYNKWRAYIDLNGKRSYLGDFNSKSKAIRARKIAAVKGIKWYKNNKNNFLTQMRKKQKRYKQKRNKDK